jgi:hypothetical protein
MTTQETYTITQATFNQRAHGTWLQIERSNGIAVECSIAHGPLVGKTQLGIFVSVHEDEDGPDDPRFAEDPTLTMVVVEDEPNLEEATLSAVEARLLRDFLNRPEVVALLDQE